MRSRDLELLSEEEKLLAKRNRMASKLSGDAIYELVYKINDYSVYNLFEPIMLMVSCNDGDDFFEKVVRDCPSLDEENMCRIKIYHLLKNSGYDDFYIEDNIEKYTEMLLNFYSNPDRIINLLNLYDELSKEDYKKKVKVKKFK